MTATIIRADARTLPLADASVDLIVTSPPYYSLRDYRDGDGSLAGQIGAEPSPGEYVAALIACTREWMRVLKPSGSMWVNLGDAYYSGKGAPGRTTVDAKSEARTARRAGGNPLDGPSFGIGRKSLVGLPWRYALACIDDLGLILRAEVIWSKPNGLPESVTDRVRRGHETWFHFTKEPRYYAAVDEIRQPHSEPNGRSAYGRVRPVIPGGNRATNVGTMDHAAHRDMGQHALGKLPGSVWEVATQPLKVPEALGIDHFAAFPVDLIRPIILGWSPPGICTACGEGLRPVAKASRRVADPFAAEQLAPGNGRGWHGGDPAKSSLGVRAHEWDRKITGYACACPNPAAPTRPAVVLDPFGGTGTSALVADVHGRHGISADMSADYCRLAQWRTSDPGERARALGVPKPPPVPEGQIDMFTEGIA